MKKNEILNAINNSSIIEESAKHALIESNQWIDCVNTQLHNRLPNENYNAHWNNIIGAIENYCTNSYPWMGYLDVQDRPNTIAIYVATNYINYVNSFRL